MIDPERTAVMKDASEATHIYVDELRGWPGRGDAPTRRTGKRHGDCWCHLWCADVNTLHRFARAIGMKREWFQDRPGFPHYDLPAFRRTAAVEAGAKEIALKDFLRARKNQLTGSAPPSSQ